MAQTFNVTNAGIDPAADRKKRTRAYLIAMAVRCLCVLLIFFTPGWFIILPILGAVFLPYFAVLVANITAATKDSNDMIHTLKTLPAPSRSAPEKTTIVVDAYHLRGGQKTQNQDSPGEI